MTTGLINQIYIVCLIMFGSLIFMIGFNFVDFFECVVSLL
jgi:hypothetical protein